MPKVLTIAGSDSGGGAGIQADLKTILVSHVYGMSAVTAITAQNTLGISGILEVTPDILQKQIDAVFEDLRPDAIKIGMTASAKLISVIIDRLRFYQAENIVLDTVLASTSGTALNHSQDALKNLIRICDLITPNIPETEILSGMTIRSEQDMERAILKLHKEFGCAVLCKGGHSETHANDVLYTPDAGMIWYRQERIVNSNTHGTGCTLSSAVACGLAKGLSLSESVADAKKLITKILTSDLDLGRGNGPLDHGFAMHQKKFEF
ncbi:MAG: bifunctional hydroxymethylpyrimidine kinase/phosphomethylpyrimidine kinase [Oscillospiraceae bacterium]|nr:bifunctional hydroxymethylpyrimidine kinase/phosphomethylpyrimidine kinase [Oscillospiraceae bacterium]